MRRAYSTLLLTGLACLLVFASGARAGVTIDVVFHDATTPSNMTIDTAVSGPGCLGYYAFPPYTHCMDVILTTTWDFQELSVSVGYDSDNGLAVDDVYAWHGIGVSFDKEGNPVAGCAPPGVIPYGGVIQYFGCSVINPGQDPPAPAGTYTLGTIIWDTGAMTPGKEVIHALFAGGDRMIAVINGTAVDVTASVVLGSHTLTIIPEPGTAALLGVGFAGLVLAARRRRAAGL